jgi:hypothetical protein
MSGLATDFTASKHHQHQFNDVPSIQISKDTAGIRDSMSYNPFRDILQQHYAMADDESRIEGEIVGSYKMSQNNGHPAGQNEFGKLLRDVQSSLEKAAEQNGRNGSADVIRSLAAPTDGKQDSGRAPSAMSFYFGSVGDQHFQRQVHARAPDGNVPLSRDKQLSRGAEVKSMVFKETVRKSIMIANLDDGNKDLFLRELLIKFRDMEDEVKQLRQELRLVHNNGQ